MYRVVPDFISFFPLRLHSSFFSPRLLFPPSFLLFSPPQRPQLVLSRPRRAARGLARGLARTARGGASGPGPGGVKRHAPPPWRRCEDRRHIRWRVAGRVRNSVGNAGSALCLAAPPARHSTPRATVAEPAERQAGAFERRQGVHDLRALLADKVIDDARLSSFVISLLARKVSLAIEARAKGFPNASSADVRRARDTTGTQKQAGGARATRGARAYAYCPLQTTSLGRRRRRGCAQRVQCTAAAGRPGRSERSRGRQVNTERGTRVSSLFRVVCVFRAPPPLPRAGAVQRRD